MIRKLLHQISPKSDPVGRGVELKVRKFDLPVTQILKGIELDLLISNNTGSHFDFTIFVSFALFFLPLKPLQNGNIGVVDRIRVIISMGLPDVGSAIGIVETFNGVELEFSEINSSLI